MEDGLCFFEEGKNRREWLDGDDPAATIYYKSSCQAGPSFGDGSIEYSVYAQLSVSDSSNGPVNIHLTSVNGDLSRSINVLSRIRDMAADLIDEIARLNGLARSQAQDIKEYVEESTDWDQVSTSGGS